VFDAARALGLPVKLHAEQLSDQGGAALAAGYGALSADHLEHLSAEGVAAMARAGTVAVLLPGAYYFLRETKLPPVAALRRAGVPIAIATDHNPGSSPTLSPLLMLNMACTLFRLTPEEALRGMTVNGARALGLRDRGQLVAGQRADFAIWPQAQGCPIEHPGELSYWLGQQVRPRVVWGGQERDKA
jgi:imidazolonepropionase